MLEGQYTECSEVAALIPHCPLLIFEWNYMKTLTIGRQYSTEMITSLHTCTVFYTYKQNATAMKKVKDFFIIILFDFVHLVDEQFYYYSRHESKIAFMYNLNLEMRLKVWNSIKNFSNSIQYSQAYRLVQCWTGCHGNEKKWRKFLASFHLISVCFVDEQFQYYSRH